MDCRIDENYPLRFFALITLLIFLLYGCSSTHETKREYVIGYQVQLVQTSDRAEAESVRAQAVLDFDQDVYLLFEAPFYKVRAGGFPDIEQADALQKLAVQKGFENAWLVRGKVNLEKVP